MENTNINLTLESMTTSFRKGQKQLRCPLSPDTEGLVLSTRKGRRLEALCFEGSKRIHVIPGKQAVEGDKCHKFWKERTAEINSTHSF